MTTIRTETETTVTTGLHRRIKVTHNEHGTYLLLEDMAPDDLRDGPQTVSARLTGNESRTIADALTGTTDHHDHPGSAFTLSDLADLRARWANETQGYDPGGLLLDTLPRARWSRAPYVEQFAPKPDPVYAVTEDEIDDVWVTIHTTATAREMIREYRTDRRTVGPGETPERLRESIRYHLQSVADLEAIARAMEQD